MRESYPRMAAKLTIKNRLLAGLSPADFAELAKELQPVSLPQRQVVYEVGAPFDYIYFIEEGLASVLTIMEDGSSSEAGMVGPEGLIGVSALLGAKTSAQHIVTQLRTEVQRIATASARAVFDNNPRVRAVLLRFIEDLLNLSSQTAGCNRLHSVEQRSARWLLMASDRIASNELALTQEFLAAMLGVRRSGVSEAASELQRSGLIRYRRGQIVIIDRAGLEKTACECYALDRQRVERLL
ncbi:MAG TPA: Crp/Fnr family transcriptional regulator [Stellaceae bacterium]|nr:Crp/Fnr family transcriptional regulator [Stellaceae bacterium]